MNKIQLSFIVSLIAGLSTMFGISSSFLKKTSQDKIIIVSLAFSSGVMVYISFFDLFISSINLISNYYNLLFSILLCVIFFFFGFILIGVFSSFFPDNLYSTGLLSFVAMVFHNIPEGIITFLLMTNDLKIGASMVISIALHNIPEGISIFTPLYYSGMKKKAYFYTFFAGFSEVLGSIIAYLFLYKFITFSFFSFLYAFTSGIMIYVSINSLMKESLRYKNKYLSYLFFALGLLFAFVISKTR